MLNKKALHKKWYYRLFQIVFLGFFIFFIFLGILGILYEDDIPLAGFFWAGTLTIAYWGIKKITEYYSQK